MTTSKTTTTRTTTTTKTTTIMSTKSKIGVLPQCTLTGLIKKLTYDGNTYCMVNHGNKNQDVAIDFCKKMNAGLPLPKSKGEAAEFSKITGAFVWIGLTDVTKSGNMAAWKDLDGNPIGNRYVNLRVIDLEGVLSVIVFSQPVVNQSKRIFHSFF